MPESRSSTRRLTSAIAYKLAGGRGRGGSGLAASAESRIAIGVASRLAARIRIRPISIRAGRLRLRPISRPTASLASSSASARSAVRVASVIANTLAQQREMRPRARFSVDAVASAIARRLRYSNTTGLFPVSRVARALATNLGTTGGVRGSAALASTIIARLARRAK